MSLESATIVATLRAIGTARESSQVIDVVRSSVRSLVGCDGATFVLRDEGRCYYVDEDAIGPLWKGQRFPIESCISGWAMTHREPVVVPDIYVDPRIPLEAYRRTFVKSLAVVPIRSSDPLGAIGAYWKDAHTATAAELDVLQVIADAACVALDNVALVRELESRVQRRTFELENAVRDLEHFAGAIAHDLRNPLQVVQLAAEELGLVEGDELELVRTLGREVGMASRRMNDLIVDLLRLSRVNAADLRPGTVDVSALVREIAGGLRAREPSRAVDVEMPSSLRIQADPGLARIVLENLVGNAWKYSGRRERATIAVGQDDTPHGPALFVRDDGAGFDMARAAALFSPFVRLHSHSEFPGTGVGLATVARIAAKHGGRAWAQAEPDRGATFWVTFAPPPTG